LFYISGTGIAYFFITKQQCLSESSVHLWTEDCEFVLVNVAAQGLFFSHWLRHSNLVAD